MKILFKSLIYAIALVSMGYWVYINSKLLFWVDEVVITEPNKLLLGIITAVYSIGVIGLVIITILDKGKKIKKVKDNSDLDNLGIGNLQL